ncbi:MAG: hypothetical protein Q7S03_00160 [bacterium]|nr:hypothetical protein [bacterium]
MFEKFRIKKEVAPTINEIKELESNLKRKEEILRERHRSHSRGSVLSTLSHHIQAGRAKLERMKDVGNREALDLNIEYDRLRAESQRALEALRDFEINKLGMLDDNEVDIKIEKE